MRGNYHAPFWNSGRRSDPSLDCNHEVLVTFALGAGDGAVVNAQAGADRFDVVGDVGATLVGDQVGRRAVA